MNTVTVVAFLSVSGVYYFFTGNADHFNDGKSSLEFGAVALTVIYFALFIVNLLMTPSRIDKEKSCEILNLNSRLQRKEVLKDAAAKLERAYEDGKNITVIRQTGHIMPSVISDAEKNNKKWVSDTLDLMKTLNIATDDIFSFENPNPMNINNEDQNLSGRRLILHRLITKYKVSHDNA